jgi:hypothetical protein
VSASTSTSTSTFTYTSTSTSTFTYTSTSTLDICAAGGCAASPSAAAATYPPQVTPNLDQTSDPKLHALHHNQTLNPHLTPPSASAAHLVSVFAKFKSKALARCHLRAPFGATPYCAPCHALQRLVEAQLRRKCYC